MGGRGHRVGAKGGGLLGGGGGGEGEFPQAAKCLRIDSSHCGPVLFFSDYFHSFQDKIACYISSERLYIFLSNDINHIIIIYEAVKLCFFHFYFFNMDSSVTVGGTPGIFKTCLYNILI